MTFIEDTLKVHWIDNQDFNLLQDRLLVVTKIINAVDGKPGKGCYNVHPFYINLFNKVLYDHTHYM